MDPETDGGEILNKIYERAKIDTIRNKKKINDIKTTTYSQTVYLGDVLPALHLFLGGACSHYLYVLLYFLASALLPLNWTFSRRRDSFATG